MSEYLAMTSFELHQGQLENWKILSAEIDKDIVQAAGFISRDSGIDEDNRVYCLVKWQDKVAQENFMAQLTSRDDWDEIMANFGSIANMETNQSHSLDLF